MGCRLAAIDQIDRIVGDEDIDCEWNWVPGSSTAPTGESSDDGRRCRKRRASPPSSASTRVRRAVPFVGTARHRVRRAGEVPSAQVPAALAQRIDGGGSFVFEHSVREVSTSRCSVTAGGHTLSCGFVVLATHTPLMGKTNMASATLLQTKLYLYTSYVVGGRLPKGTVPERLFWDTADPYHYLRIDPAISTTRSSAARITRPGRPTTRALLRALEGRRSGDSGARDHPSLVGPGRRNQRRPAVHRRDLAAAVRRDRLCRQRHDVRHARRHDGARRATG